MLLLPRAVQSSGPRCRPKSYSPRIHGQRPQPQPRAWPRIMPLLLALLLLITPLLLFINNAIVNFILLFLFCQRHNGIGCGWGGAGGAAAERGRGRERIRAARRHLQPSGGTSDAPGGAACLGRGRGLPLWAMPPPPVTRASAGRLRGRGVPPVACPGNGAAPQGAR